MESHLHAGIMTGLIILAWMILWHFLLRGTLAHHADSPVAQGLSNLT